MHTDAYRVCAELASEKGAGLISGCPLPVDRAAAAAATVPFQVGGNQTIVPQTITSRADFPLDGILVRNRPI
jgi:hypothetical protein